MTCPPSLGRGPGLTGSLSARAPGTGGAVPAGSEPGREGSSRSCHHFCGGSGCCLMGSVTGRGGKSQEPICTRKAVGPAQAYWQALLTGDRGTVAEILSDPQNNLSPNAVFDTSDLEEWKNYRFNLRRLSTQGGSGQAAWPSWTGDWSLLLTLQGITISGTVCYGCCLGCRGVGMAVRALGWGWVPLCRLWEGVRMSGSVWCIWGTRPF